MPVPLAATAAWTWGLARRPPPRSLRAPHRAAISRNRVVRRPAPSTKTRAMRRHALWLWILLVGVAGPVDALDHKNLDEGRPTRLDDAYTIAAGEIEVEVGAGA